MTVRLPAAQADEVLPILDGYTKLIAQLGT